MRHKLRLLNLILIVVFIFSFTACNVPKTATETTAEATVTETTAQIEETETTTAVEITETEEEFEDSNKDFSGPEDKKIFEIGDIIKFDDLEFSVNGITAEEGSEDINLFIEVSIKNNGDVDRKISSYTMFELLDEFQRKQTYSLSGSKNDIEGAVIPPGKTLTGEISFIVPEDVKEFDLKVGLNLSTEEVEFLNNMLKQFFAGEDISAADIKRAEELENREYVMVKIFLE